MHLNCYLPENTYLPQQEVEEVAEVAEVEEGARRKNKTILLR
jgi:hypothetical protein